MCFEPDTARKSAMEMAMDRLEAKLDSIEEAVDSLMETVQELRINSAPAPYYSEDYDGDRIWHVD